MFLVRPPVKKVVSDPARTQHRDVGSFTRKGCFDVEPVVWVQPFEAGYAEVSIIYMCI